MVFNRNRWSLQPAQGFTIIETIVVTCVLVSLMSLGSRYITQNAERTVNQITAQQLQQVTQAAQQYVQDHYQIFKESPNPLLKWQDLVDQGYLPNKISAENHYGQAYQFTVLEERDQLQILLTTEGGNPIRESSLRHIAARAGSAAGYASGLHKNKIVGNQESWFVEGTPLQEGHLASLTIVNEKEIMNASTFLRRTQLAGRPDYSRMEIDLEIAENNKISYGKNGFQLSKTDFSITDDKGSFIQISGGGNKFLKITHPKGGGEEMHLWSNILTLENKNNHSKISMENRGTIGINIERDGNSSGLTDKEFFVKNKYNQSTISPDLINAYAEGSIAQISAVAPYQDSTARFSHIQGWSQKSELTAHWLRLPVYHSKAGNFGSGTSVAHNVCGAFSPNSKEFDVPTGNGRLFMVTEEASEKMNIFICTKGKAQIVVTRPLNPGE